MLDLIASRGSYRVFGGRRGLVAVLAAASVVLGVAQASGMVVVDPTSAPPATRTLADVAPDAGTTTRTSLTNAGGQSPTGGHEAMVSGNGRYTVFTSTSDLDPDSPAGASPRSGVFVRDLRDGTTHQLSLGRATLPASGRVSSDGTPPNGASFAPSISADGRYVTFLTSATNIVPVAAGPAPTTLVACDRDPAQHEDADGEFILDVAGVTPGVPANVCEAVVSTAASSATGIFSTDRPRVSGDGTHLVWTQRVTSSTTAVEISRIAFAGALQTPTAPVAVPANVTSADPRCETSGIGFAAGPMQAAATSLPVISSFDPVPSADASRVVMGVQFSGQGCVGVVRTDLSNNNSLRLDINAANTGYLGDFNYPTERVTLQSISASDSAGQVAFTYSHTDPPPPPPVKFRSWSGDSVHSVAAATTPVHHVYLAQNASGGAVTSDIVSTSEGGAPVDSLTGAISGDGRFVAFETTDDNAFTGTGVTGQQLVARDLTLRVNALATPIGTCGVPVCPSGVIGDIFLDHYGSRVSFTSSSADVVTDADNNNFTDAFVRTWQPGVTGGTTNVGNVEVGTDTEVEVPMTAAGFGPLVLGDAAVSGSPDFTVTGQGCSSVRLYDGGSCSVTVDFTPSAVGAATGTLLLSSEHSGVLDGRTLNATGVLKGQVVAPADTVRGSLTDGSQQAPDGGSESMISGNGRWLVFTSSSDLTNRPVPDPNPNDAFVPTINNVFVRDVANGRTVQISLHDKLSTTATKPSIPTDTVAANGSNPDDNSFAPSISSDGRFVSFLTRASDIVPNPLFAGAGDTSVYTLVVCDRDPKGTRDAVTGELVLDQPQAQRTVPDYACFPVDTAIASTDDRQLDTGTLPRLSGDGTRITWVQSSQGTSKRARVARLASKPGAALRRPNQFLFVPSDVGHYADTSDGSGPFDAEQDHPVLTEDGSAVVFVGFDTYGPGRAVVESTLPPAIADSTSRQLDLVPPGGGINGPYLGNIGGLFSAPAVSDDGSRVAFAFQAPGGTRARVYAVTLVGDQAVSQLESVTNGGDASFGDSPALSGDGRYLAFETDRLNMHNGLDVRGSGEQCVESASNICQVVARDLVQDAQRAAAGLSRLPSQLVSRSRDKKCRPAVPADRTCAGDESSLNPSIDATGSEIAFDSYANDLVPGDTNDTTEDGAPVPTEDAFVLTWRPSLDVPTMDFGSVKLGSSKTRSFAVTPHDVTEPPTEFGPLSLGTASISGPDAADFQVVTTTCAGETLHAGMAPGTDKCTYKIRFTPQAPGPRTATLKTPVGKNSFPRTSPDGTKSYDPAIQRNLTGFGATPIIATSPTLNFGNRRAKDPLTKTLIVTNTGSTALVITTVIVNDTTHPGSKNDYTVNFGDCLPQVAVGASCVISVTFSGSRVGVRDAVMVISSNASGGPTSVGLLARVIKPTIESNPAVSPIRRVITITGTNFAPHRLVEVGFDGVVQDSKKTDAHGSFSLNIVVLPDGPQGPRTLFGHSVGLSPTIRGEFSFLVVLGAGDPGSGDVIRD